MGSVASLARGIKYNTLVQSLEYEYCMVSSLKLLKAFSYFESVIGTLQVPPTQPKPPASELITARR